MAITHLSLVNQTLVNAGTLLGMLTALGVPETTSQRLQHRVLMDSSVLHLARAYGFYLRELGENYRIKGLAHISRADQLALALLNVDKSPSEAQELVALEKDAQSWLSQMLAADLALHASPEQPKPAKAFTPEGLISVVDMSDEITLSPSLDLALLELWLAEFRSLILRQRETSAEY